MAAVGIDKEVLRVADRLRVVLFSHAPRGFAVAHEACEAAGHQPVAYVYARSLRPRRPPAPRAAAEAGRIAEAMPPDMDLLVPASARSLLRALPGYRPDLLVCNGFPWRLPGALLRLPRLGALNIHHSLLPRYRGPIPVHWAIRDGERHTGVTVHWMDEDFDTGDIVVQRGGVPIADEFDPDQLLADLNVFGGRLLTEALERVREG
ncbi:methionyl-tRNA formyltransferase, partial [Streptomyces sp. SB3404]|nr:methionyl-tRNA formyltransferase [Streptomyces boncukensis]